MGALRACTNKYDQHAQRRLVSYDSLRRQTGTVMVSAAQSNAHLPKTLRRLSITNGVCRTKQRKPTKLVAENHFRTWSCLRFRIGDAKQDVESVCTCSAAPNKNTLNQAVGASGRHEDMDYNMGAAYFELESSSSSSSEPTRRSCWPFLPGVSSLRAAILAKMSFLVLKFALFFSGCQRLKFSRCRGRPRPTQQGRHSGPPSSFSELP